MEFLMQAVNLDGMNGFDCGFEQNQDVDQDIERAI
jgi:hypothetical protein